MPQSRHLWRATSDARFASRAGDSYVPAMKPLPAIFAACCPEGRWLVVAPSEWPGVRTFDRTELRAVDSGGLGASSEDDRLIRDRARTSPMGVIFVRPDKDT